LRPFLPSLALFLALLGAAGTVRAGSIEVSDAWARATVVAGQPSAVYLTVRNAGATPDRLIGLASAKADRIELHESKMVGAAMTMAPVDGLDLAPGATVKLAPGGYHAMIFGLAAPLNPGDTLPLTLTFEHGGTVTLAVPVKPLGASQ
jgi:periplasmic copper chaperone A